MSPLTDLIDKGGPAVIAIMALSVLLYARCVRLVLVLWSAYRSVHAIVGPAHDFTRFARQQMDEVEAFFRRERIVIGSMIAAAPLLGLLGTVSGMTKTFSALTERSAESTMEGLAQGISEVLVATESGLLVAIPALGILCLAHHVVRCNLRALNQAAALRRAAHAP